MEIGERWAYEIPKVYTLTEVIVMKIGTRKPARVLIRFIDDEFEGGTEWVTPLRLKGLWSEVEALNQRRTAWVVMLSKADGFSDLESCASDQMFFRYIPASVAKMLHSNGSEGITQVFDWPSVEDLTGVAKVSVSADIFQQHGDSYVSWETTLAIIKGYASNHATQVLADLERDEIVERREAVFGRQYPRGGDYVWPEHCAEYYDEFTGPMNDLLRSWVGGALAERNELIAAREANWKVVELLNSAIESLLDGKQLEAAWKLHVQMYPGSKKAKWKSIRQAQSDRAKELMAEQEIAWRRTASRNHEASMKIDAKAKIAKAKVFGSSPPPWAIHAQD